jgi:hypothetical protein
MQESQEINIPMVVWPSKCTAANLGLYRPVLKPESADFNLHQHHTRTEVLYIAIINETD